MICWPNFSDPIHSLLIHKLSLEHHTQIYLYYASPILIVSGVFILVAAVLNLTLAEPRVIIVQRVVAKAFVIKYILVLFLCQLLCWIIFSNYQRPPVNHPDDVSEPSMTAPTSPIMPSPRSPIIRKVPLKVQIANLYTHNRIFSSNYFGKFCYLFEAARQKNAFQYN